MVVHLVGVKRSKWVEPPLPTGNEGLLHLLWVAGFKLNVEGDQLPDGECKQSGMKSHGTFPIKRVPVWMSVRASQGARPCSKSIPLPSPEK